jgi:SNF2 family DNA or RNA helicase
MLRTARARVERHLQSERFVRSRVATLRAHQARCEACEQRRCDAIAATCAHALCRACYQHATACPVCGGALGALTEVARIDGVGTKMAAIGELVVAAGGAPLVLFVQWKSMMRGTRAFLRSIGERVLLLDGNATQRASTLAEFQTGGVLLLCLEECFSGLHLPHVTRIVFAHAIVGDRDRVAHLEQQAIARCVRPGQTRAVEVHSFVVSDSEEETLWRRTHDGAAAPRRD